MPGFREEVQAMVRGDAPLSPYDRQLGIRLLEAQGGASRLEVEVDERFHNPAQVLHGGILSGLVDSAMAYAVATVLDANETCTNIDLTIRFLRATVRGRLTATARVVRAGRTVLVVECDVAAEGGEAVVRASSSFLRRNATSGSGWLPQARRP